MQINKNQAFYFAFSLGERRAKWESHFLIFKAMFSETEIQEYEFYQMTKALYLWKYAKMCHSDTDFQEFCSDAPAYNFHEALLNVY